MKDNIMISYEGLVREYVEKELYIEKTDEEIQDIAIRLEKKLSEQDIDSMLWDLFLDMV